MNLKTNFAADLNFRRIRLMQLPKVFGEPKMKMSLALLVSQSKKKVKFMKNGSMKNEFGVEIIHGSSRWMNLVHFHAFRMPNHPASILPGNSRTMFSLFIFVFVFTSNPTLSGFSPPRVVSAARFDVELQFIRLSHWTLPRSPSGRVIWANQ